MFTMLGTQSWILTEKHNQYFRVKRVDRKSESPSKLTSSRMYH